MQFKFNNNNNHKIPNNPIVAVMQNDFEYNKVPISKKRKKSTLDSSAYYNQPKEKLFIIIPVDV